MAGPLALDNPFWTFSLEVYAAPGVEAECLALQEDRGIDINVVLFCAWLGATKQSVLSADDFAAIDTLVAPWRETVVHDLRSSRRALKAMPEMAYSEVAQLRKDIAALELRAEQIEQALLYQWAAGMAQGEAAPAEAIRANVGALLRRHGGDGEAASQLIGAAAKA
jgi:uncharacterized protein (TIGR02444 family)